MYQSQRKVAVMMRKFAQPVRTEPQMIEDNDERLLAGNLIAEEITELLKSIGFRLEGKFVFDPAAPTNLVLSADGIGDAKVVLEGLANRMGIDSELCFEEANRTNMLKFNADGTITKRKSDKKVIKPSTWREPNFAHVLGTQPALDYGLDGIEPAPVVIFDDTIAA